MSFFCNLPTHLPEEPKFFATAKPQAGFTDFTEKPRYFATNFHELALRNFGHRAAVLDFKDFF